MASSAVHGSSFLTSPLRSIYMMGVHCTTETLIIALRITLTFLFHFIRDCIRFLVHKRTHFIHANVVDIIYELSFC